MVFLGGTLGNNRWREEIVIPALLARGIPAEELFNPRVSTWDAAAQLREDAIKARARYRLYVIAHPQLPGQSVSAYSLVEAVMDLYDHHDCTVVVIDRGDLPEHTALALGKAYADLKQRFPTAALFEQLADAVEWLAARLIHEPLAHQGNDACGS